MTAESVWFITAWGLVGLAGVLAVWALWGDRIRHIRRGLPARCPTCWYDMSVSRPNEVGAYQCPECGKLARHERRLHRSRRRWCWLLPVPLALAGAWCAACIPEVNARGWWAMAPRPALFWALPEVQPGRPPSASAGQFSAAEELRVRVLGEFDELVPLYWPERVLLRNRAVGVLARDDASDAARVTAAHVLVRLDADALRSAPERGRANVILAKMELTYASMRSFRCRGTVFGNIGARDEKPFLIAMQRPDRFRFEFMDGFPFELTLTKRYAIWKDGPTVHSWWTIQPGTETLNDLSLALSAATGVSSGSAYAVPSMLLTDVMKGSRFSRIGAPELLEDGPVAGRDCYRVRGSFRSTAAETMWIDKETFMLLRHDDFLGMTTVYTPERDVPIDPAWFQFDPDRQDLSPLQDPGRQPRPEGMPPPGSAMETFRRGR
jgi:outer membrane lipoprotein-sorting protein